MRPGAGGVKVPATRSMAGHSRAPPGTPPDRRTSEPHRRRRLGGPGQWRRRRSGCVPPEAGGPEISRKVRSRDEAPVGPPWLHHHRPADGRQRRPADVATATAPVDPGRRPHRPGNPNPAVIRVHRPTAVVKGGPAPAVVHSGSTSRSPTTPTDRWSRRAESPRRRRWQKAARRVCRPRPPTPHRARGCRRNWPAPRRPGAEAQSSPGLTPGLEETPAHGKNANKSSELSLDAHRFPAAFLALPVAVSCRPARLQHIRRAAAPECSCRAWRMEKGSRCGSDGRNATRPRGASRPCPSKRTATQVPAAGADRLLKGDVFHVQRVAWVAGSSTKPRPSPSTTISTGYRNTGSTLAPTCETSCHPASTV